MDSAIPLKKLLNRYGIGDTSDEARSFLSYLALLEKWNPRVNLTASTEWSALGWLFEEALWAARMYPPGRVEHLDIGSGAGFPALALRIMRPEMRLRMVESRAKRAFFLESSAAELGLTGIEVFGCRVEEYLRSTAASGFDVASWKGVRLSHDAFRLLLAAGRPNASFWMFHGRSLPIEDPASVEGALNLSTCAILPGHPNCRLSIYTVSRETGPV